MQLFQNDVDNMNANFIQFGPGVESWLNVVEEEGYTNLFFYSGLYAGRVNDASGDFEQANGDISWETGDKDGLFHLYRANQTYWGAAKE